MKILHYTLGFPPKRSGGLVKYAIDLMEEQCRQGHEVNALYPGKLNLFTEKTYIRSVKSGTIKKYQIINSLPLAIFGGIKTPEDFMKKIPTSMYIDFLKFTNPEIIHVHSLMGIHKEFFQAAKELKIRIIYTTHDYFGLAPEPNFFMRGETYSQENTVENWIIASEKALSTTQLKVFQLGVYPFIKRILKFLRKKGYNAIDKEENNNTSIIIDKKKKSRYSKLKEYYQEIFSLVSGFHFNSTLTEEIYISNIHSNLVRKVITITNSNINNNRMINKNVNSRIRLAYIGPNKEFKGFNKFIELSSHLPSDKYEFHTYGYEPMENIANIYQHGRYNSIELVSIYKNIDILIVPSIWKETFGLIVLEALSNNTPVLVSDNVGAKDLIPDNYIFYNTGDLKNIIENKMNINDFSFKTKSISFHTKEITSFYNWIDK